MRVLGWTGVAFCLAVFLLGCLREEAEKAANQIGISRYEDMVKQFGPPNKRDSTFTGRARATWIDSLTNSPGRVSSDDLLILTFGKNGLLEKVKYKDGTDDQHLINPFSGSFTCDERGMYPGGPAWPKEEQEESQTTGTIPEKRFHKKEQTERWRSQR